MRKLIVFNHVSLDGYFTDANSDMRWAHKRDEEWNTFIKGNAKGDCVFVFGRKTYDMMASYWPTPMASENSPEVAESMNKLPKIVFSRTLDKASWNNTKLVKSDPAAEVRRLKQESGPDLMIFGSGTIISQLTQEGLIDEFQIIVCPMIVGKGKALFEGVQGKPGLKLTKSRIFKNGNVFLVYEPAA